SDEEVLNLAPGFTQQDIQSSYDYLTEVFHHCYYSSDQFHDLKAILKSIVDRLAQAHRNLIKVEHHVDLPAEILATSEVDPEVADIEPPSEADIITEVVNPFPEKIELEDYAMQFEPTPPPRVEAVSKQPEEPSPPPETIYSDQDALDVPIQMPPM